MRRVAMLSALLASLAVTAFALSQTRRGEKYAFLIVCSAYNSTQLRDLPFTIDEMHDFRNALIKTGFDADNFDFYVEGRR